MNSLEKLLNKFAIVGARDAIVDSDGRTTSYSKLHSRILELSIQFRKEKIVPGTSVQLFCDYGAEDISWLFALWTCGAVVTPVSPSSEEASKRYGDISAAEVSAYPRENRLHRYDRGLSVPLIKELSGDPGLIIYSSGTTGAPKGAVHSVKRLLKKFERSGKGFRTVGFLLFDHISGIDTLLYTLSASGTILCVSDRDPDSVSYLIESERAEVLPTAPSFLNFLLMSGVVRNYDYSSLKIISYGGEMMPQSLLDRVSAEFPTVQIYQKYGASEIGAIRSKSMDSTSRWISFDPAGANWRVEDGLLEVKTETAMLGYLNAPSPFTVDGWYRTGDRVEVRDNFIRFLGRDSDLISIGGQKVYPSEIEAALRENDDVLDAIAFGQPHAMLGAIVVAKLQMRSEVADARIARAKIRKNLVGKLEPHKIPQKIDFTLEPLTNSRYKKVRG